jgi:hypothetical protein
MSDAVRTVRNTVMFLRMMAIHLRRMAADGEGNEQMLLHMAERCDAEAAELADYFGIPT